MSRPRGYQNEEDVPIKDHSLALYEKELERKREKEEEATYKDVEKEVTRSLADVQKVSEVVSRSILPFTPTEKQQQFVEMLLQGKLNGNETARVTYTSIAKKLGVKNQTVAMWFQDVAFRLYVEECRRMLFFHYKPIIDRTLIRKAAAGSYKHMELFYTLVGDINKTLELQTKEDKRIDSMGVSEQYSVFQNTIMTITGRLHHDDAKEVPKVTETKVEEAEEIVDESEPDAGTSE